MIIEMDYFSPREFEIMTDKKAAVKFDSTNFVKRNTAGFKVVTDEVIELLKKEPINDRLF